MTILGISVGTVRTGICVLKDGELHDGEYRVYKNQGPVSEKKLDAIAKAYRQYLRKYPITAVMVKIPPLSRQSDAIRSIIKRIEALAREFGCELDLITKTELKEANSLRSTEEIIDFARRLFPELDPLFQRGLKNGHSYYRKVYEAVLAAHTLDRWLGWRKDRELRGTTNQ
jgi:hypothetical protein